MKYFKCFSARLASYLHKRGFKIEGTEPNLKKPQFDVFLFHETPELKIAVDEYCRGI